MGEYPFYPDRDRLIVEHDGERTTQPCGRIPLGYPDLRGRAEACMGRAPNGDIYAAVGATCGAMGEGIQPTQRLFRSSVQSTRAGPWCSPGTTPDGPLTVSIIASRRRLGFTWTVRQITSTERPATCTVSMMSDDPTPRTTTVGFLTGPFRHRWAMPAF